jgi:gamma-tubulin complex component 2
MGAMTEACNTVQITDKIASTRASSRIGIDVEEEDDYALQGMSLLVYFANANSDLDDSDDSDEPSFIEEKSFVNAPLNSRVPLQSASSKGKGKGKAKAESLEKIPVEIQEALVLEDLLFVLMVSYSFCVQSLTRVIAR